MFINPKGFSRTPNQSLPSILINPYIIGFILSFINIPFHISAPIHIARHTFASLQVELGTDLYTVMQLLAHKSVTTTQIYACHADPKRRETATRISSKVLGKEKKAK